MDFWRISISQLLIAVTLFVVLGVITFRCAEDYVVANSPIVWHSIDSNLVSEIECSKHIWIVNEYYSEEPKRISLSWHLENSSDVKTLRRFAASNNLKFVYFDISEESEAATDFLEMLQECAGYWELEGGIYMLDPGGRFVLEIGTGIVSCEDIMRVVNEFKKEP